MLIFVHGGGGVGGVTKKEKSEASSLLTVIGQPIFLQLVLKLVFLIPANLIPAQVLLKKWQELQRHPQ